jgi:polyhydroxyalkanoate synthesis regulator phasin
MDITEHKEVMMKQTLKIGITVLVVAALTMSGIALAQTDESTDEPVNQQAVTKIVEKLQGLVDDGTISADQAQAVAEALAEGFRPGGHRGHRGPNLGAVAGFLEMEVEDFRAALQEYDTLADLAAANGSSAEELIDFLVSKADERLAQAVENGRIDQAEADEKLVEIEEKITEMVNSEIPEPGDRQGRPGRRGPGGGEGPAGGEDAGFQA